MSLVSFEGCVKLARSVPVVERKAGGRRHSEAVEGHRQKVTGTGECAKRTVLPVDSP